MVLELVQLATPSFPFFTRSRINYQHLNIVPIQGANHTGNAARDNRDWTGRTGTHTHMITTGQLVKYWPQWSLAVAVKRKCHFRFHTCFFVRQPTVVLITVSLIIYGLPFSRFATDIGLAEPYSQLAEVGKEQGDGVWLCMLNLRWLFFLLFYAS